MAGPELTPELLALASAADETVKDRAAILMATMLAEIEHQMASAPPNTKHSLMQKVLPVLMKMGDQNRHDEQLAAMRAEMDTLQAEMAQALLGGRELVQADFEAPELPPEDMG